MRQETKSFEERNPYKAQIVKDASDVRLHQKCRKVKEPHSNETFAIIDSMKKIMVAAKAVGLAAPQVGINRRIIVVLNDASGTIDEFINPEIVEAHETDANMEWHMEGCLSHPGIFAEVARPNHIIFKAQRLQDSKPQVFGCQGFISQIIQHEIDHCDGVLFTDKGIYFRNPTFDPIGQKELYEAITERKEEGQKDWKVD